MEGLCFTLLGGAFGEEVEEGFFVDGEGDKVFEALEGGCWREDCAVGGGRG
jgi:hypothetical protein